jgi:L-amino acid N-acyltransferase YncA
MVLRDATPDDAPAITAIYTPYVRTSCFSFEEVPPSAAEIAARMARIRQAGLPYLVAVDSDAAVIGYAYAGPYHARSAYRFTVENSVYVAADRLREGIGAALMQKLIADCAALGYRRMVAVIADSPASVALHRRLGFQPAGVLPAIGYKLGRWIDVTYMLLTLGDGS